MPAAAPCPFRGSRVAASNSEAVFWHRVSVVVVVVLVTLVVARIVDRRMARRELTPGQATLYRVLRRSIVTAIVVVGVLSALLTIPAFSTVAGGLLASSAVARARDRVRRPERRCRTSSRGS